jgi:uncharacterized DUF497 family protein
MENEFEKIIGFQWDKGNINKNLFKYNVENWECEQIFFNEPLTISDDPKHSISEKRWAVFGSTDAGRQLVVIFTKRDQRIRVIKDVPYQSLAKIYLARQIALERGTMRR